jgi:hypothetical protein
MWCLGAAIAWPGRRGDGACGTGAGAGAGWWWDPALGPPATLHGGEPWRGGGAPMRHTEHTGKAGEISGVWGISSVGESPV